MWTTLPLAPHDLSQVSSIFFSSLFYFGGFFFNLDCWSMDRGCYSFYKANFEAVLFGILVLKIDLTAQPRSCCHMLHYSNPACPYKPFSAPFSPAPPLPSSPTSLKDSSSHLLNISFWEANRAAIQLSPLPSLVFVFTSRSHSQIRNTALTCQKSFVSRI